MSEIASANSNKGSIFYAILIYVNAFFFGMYPFLNSGANAAYITVLICTVSVIVIITALSFLLDKFNINTQNILSPPIMRYVSGVFFVFSVINCAILLACTVQCSFRFFMPQSPYTYLAMFFCISVIFGIHAGHGALKSYGKVISVCIFALALYFVFSSFKSAQIQRIFPLLGQNAKSTFLGFSGISVFSNIIYLYAYNKQNEALKYKKLLFTAIKTALSAGIFISVMCFVYAMCVPYEIIRSKILLPSYYIASVSGFGIIFNRCEILLLTAWIFSSMVSLSFMANTTAVALCDALKLSDRRGISPVTTLLIFTISVLLLKFNIIYIWEKFSHIFTAYIIHLPIVCILINNRYQKRKVKNNVAVQNG